MIIKSLFMFCALNYTVCKARGDLLSVPSQLLAFNNFIQLIKMHHIASYLWLLCHALGKKYFAFFFLAPRRRGGNVFGVV